MLEWDNLKVANNNLQYDEIVKEKNIGPKMLIFMALYLERTKFFLHKIILKSQNLQNYN